MATDFFSTLESPDANTCGDCLTAACAAMKIIYCRAGSGIPRDESRDAIEVLILADHPVFHARYNSPSGAICDPAARPDGGREVDAIVMLLDRPYFEQKSRLALGNEVPRLEEGYAAADGFMRELGNALLCDFRRGEIPTSAYVESLAGVIAIHLAKNHCRRYRLAPASIGLPRHKLNRVLAFIIEHIGDAIPLHQLASIAHLSPYHFARMFKQATGYTPHVYITRQRVERAKELLRDTHAALVEVASSVGFETQSHFTGVFHRYAGVTPRVFRLDAQLSDNSRPSNEASHSARHEHPMYRLIRDTDLRRNGTVHAVP